MEHTRLDMLQTKVTHIYRRWRKDAFPSGSCPVDPVELVELTEDTSCLSDGYMHERNRIRLVIDAEDMESIESADEEGVNDLFKGLLYPKWVVHLLHEMSHEYESKVVGREPTPRGREVRLQCQAQYLSSDTHHGIAFFTGVAAVAEKLKLDPVALVQTHGL